MAGKKIITAVAGVLAFGGIIANSCVFAVKTNKLNDRLNEEINLRQAAEGSLLEVIEATKAELKTSINTVKADLEQKINNAKTDITNLSKTVTEGFEAVDEKFAEIDEIVALYDENFEIINENFNIIIGALNELYTAVDDNSSWIDVIVEYINTTLSNALNSLNTQISNLKATMNTIISATSYLLDFTDELDARVSLLEQDLEAVKESYATIDFVNGEVGKIMALINSGDANVKAIEERFEQSDSIIEEVLKGIVEIIRNQCPGATSIHVESYIDDSVPKNMPVKVEIDTAY